MGRLAIIGMNGWIGRAVWGMVAKRESNIEAFSVSLHAPLITSEHVREALRPDPDLTVMCLAGLKSGGKDQLYAANAQLPALIVESLDGSGAHVVHIGSAGMTPCGGSR